jgi:hypothetical protein
MAVGCGLAPTQGGVRRFSSRCQATARDVEPSLAGQSAVVSRDGLVGLVRRVHAPGAGWQAAAVMNSAAAARRAEWRPHQERRNTHRPPLNKGTLSDQNRSSSPLRGSFMRRSRRVRRNFVPWNRRPISRSVGSRNIQCSGARNESAIPALIDSGGTPGHHTNSSPGRGG